MKNDTPMSEGIPTGAGLWNQLVVDDPHCLSGPSVATVLTAVIEKCGLTKIVAFDLEGAYTGLRGLEGEVIPSTEFLKRVADATQYDWGWFFLYGKDHTPPSQRLDDWSMITNADITIRLVDDTYIYFYWSDRAACVDVRNLFPASEMKSCSLTDLDMPN